MTGLWEAVPNTCDAPGNRGASPTDRSTWSAAIGTTSGCNTERDATTEEVLHLITEAAVLEYPSTWGKTFSSTAGAAIQAANGDCGWGYSSDFQDPASTACSGQYAYDDDTCDLGCIIVEGIYWASISYMGGLYTTGRADSIKHEWLMPTPDDSMNLLPSGVANARTLQSGSPALYALVSDTTSTGHAWLPAIMPDGNYVGNASSALDNRNPTDSEASGGGGCGPGCIGGIVGGCFVPVLLVVLWLSNAFGPKCPAPSLKSRGVSSA